MCKLNVVIFVLLFLVSCEPDVKDNETDKNFCELVVANSSKEDIFPSVASEDLGIVASETYKSINIVSF